MFLSINFSTFKKFVCLGPSITITRFWFSSKFELQTISDKHVVSGPSLNALNAMAFEPTKDAQLKL